MTQKLNINEHSCGTCHVPPNIICCYICTIDDTIDNKMFKKKMKEWKKSLKCNLSNFDYYAKIFIRFFSWSKTFFIQLSMSVYTMENNLVNVMRGVNMVLTLGLVCLAVFYGLLSCCIRNVKQYKRSVLYNIKIAYFPNFNSKSCITSLSI